ncbi:MAG: hypothetical protein IJS33_00350 [Firmicutes bacterium]|nr:hypothetical protein [Bacillota bacterium]
MKRKLLSIILIMVMLFTAVRWPEAVFAEETTEVSGATDPADESTAYLKFDVKAPKGSIVKVESIQHDGKGFIDDSGKIAGEFGPEMFSEGIEEFFITDPRNHLGTGDYYYRITQVDQSDKPGRENVKYDDSEYVVWLYIDYLTDDAGNYLDKNGNITANVDNAAKRMSIVLQKDDEHEKPLGIEFENCVTKERTFKRIITYTEYTPDGKIVSSKIEETVTVERTLRSDSEGNPIDKDGNPVPKGADGEYDESKLIYIGENENPLAYDESGRPYETNDDGTPALDENGNVKYTTKWRIKSVAPADRTANPIVVGEDGKAVVTTAIESPDHPRKDSEGWAPDKDVVEAWEIDLNNPPPDGHVEKIPVIYVLDIKEEQEELTVTRTITYTEYTPDGKEVAKTVTQKVTLKRTKTTYPNGRVVYGDWEIVDGDRSAVKSPDHKEGADKWTPNTPLVGEWEIDLKNPKDEVVHVVYLPKDEPLPPVEVEEYLTITRTITYTEYTAIGKEVSRTITQTVTLKRIRTEDADGNVLSYGDWEIVDGDQSAVTSPTKKDWTANILNVPAWEIDLKNPQSVVIHVIYAPNSSIDTGDENNLTLWGGVLGAAVLILIILLIARRKKDKADAGKSDDESNS